MPTGLTYSSYITQISQMAVVEPTNAEFLAILPAMIDYAELRIYRDLDLLSTVTRSTAYSFSVGSRTLSVPASAFITIQELNVLTPAGSTNADSATRNALLPASKEFLNAVYPSSTGASVPQFFAMIDQNTMIVGPWPDAGYTVEITGTSRPATLSADNNSTFISQQLPDLFIMASMIYISAFQRNFGRQSDDPQMAQSYEAQYKTLMAGAMVEEMRKKFSASAWSSMAPPVVASPTR